MIHPLVVGTAGHIDHGKTALVRALTGIDTDRLPVEKQRGITTELGFARLTLGDRTIAVVDVPGHERFVKSMVAGATGIDLVLLVIAADEGVMPQTREHIEICDLIGVRRGIVVITKTDLVDSEWLAMVVAEIRAALAATAFAAAPMIGVSTKTGDGLPALCDELGRQIAELPPRATSGVFRLPIDRVFTVKGFGTIVTGTVLGGEVVLDAELEVIASGLCARVRGIEVHGSPVALAGAGARVALNLGGIAVDELTRGDMLAPPGRVAGSHILDVELRYLHTAPGPLPARSKVLLHHATSQVLASLHLVERELLLPGETAFAQLRLDRATPLGAVPEDPFIVRGFVATPSSGSTIGGGRIIRVLAPKARKSARHAQVVAALAGAHLDQQLALDIKTTSAAGLALTELVRRRGVPPDVLAEPLATLAAAGELLITGEGEHAHYLHAQTVAALEHRIADALGPEGMPRERLRTQLPAALPARAFDAILHGLQRRGLVATEADRVRRASSPHELARTPHELAVLAILEAKGVEPPRPKELAAVTGLSEPQAKAALDRLIAAKLVVKIKPDLVMHARTVDDVRARLVAFLDSHDTIDTQQWKELTGASRKYTIPIAEYFDGEKLTLRVGEVRKLRAQKK